MFQYTAYPAAGKGRPGGIIRPLEDRADNGTETVFA